MKLYKLEALRGLAALYVVLYHVMPREILVFGANVGVLFRFGQEAVILFFLLSGFVIDLSFQQSRDKSFTTYFAKRFYRIYIPLLMVFLVSYVLACWQASAWVSPQWGTLLLNLLMLQDLGELKPAVIVQPYLDNSPLWSLSYEWWFYMLYYPIARQMQSAKKVTWIVSVIALLAALWYLLQPQFLVRHLMYFAIWWCGVWMSQLYRSGQAINIPNMLPALLGLGGVSALMLWNVVQGYQAGTLTGFGFHPVLELRHFASAFAFILLAMLWRRLRWVGFDVLIKPFARIAPMSYLIYIAHYPLMVQANYLDFLGDPVWQWLGYSLVLLVFSQGVEVILYPRIRARLMGWTAALRRRAAAP